MPVLLTIKYFNNNLLLLKYFQQINCCSQVFPKDLQLTRANSIWLSSSSWVTKTVGGLRIGPDLINLFITCLLLIQSGWHCYYIQLGPTWRHPHDSWGLLDFPFHLTQFTEINWCVKNKGKKNVKTMYVHRDHFIKKYTASLK